MKNTRKRFLSLVMAMMMLLGCMVTASAADVADTTSAGNDNGVVLSTPNGDEDIMPLADITYLTGEIAVGNNQSSSTGNFQMDSGHTLAIVIASSVRVKVTIKERLFGESKVTYINSTNNAGKVIELAKPSGNLLNYVIEKEGSGTFAFQLVAIS